MAPDLLTPPGQGDDGRADEGLLAALRSGDRSALASAMPTARVFVGIEASLLSSDETTGADKTSDMVLVTLRAPSGAGALPVFTAVQALAAWRPTVRPVPVALPDACAEAVRLGLDAVVIDLGGPAPVTLDVRDVRDVRDVAGGPAVAPAGERAAASAGGPVGDPADRSVGATAGPAPDGTGLRPRRVSLDGRSRRRIRAALAGLPGGTEVWPAELAGRAHPPRPVLAVALTPGDDETGNGTTVDYEDRVAEVVRRLRGAVDQEPEGGTEANDSPLVLVVRPSEAPGVRAHLGRGLRPVRPGLFRR